MLSQERAELLERLRAELRQQVHYLRGMLEDIEAGTYSSDDARTDFEHLTGGSPLSGLLDDLETYGDADEAEGFDGDGMTGDGLQVGA